jgi:hypothetical protein
MLSDGCCDGGIDDLGDAGKANDDFMDVGAGEILEDGGDQHDEEVAAAIEEERAHQVPYSFEDEIAVLRQVDSVDVRKGS